MAAIAAAVADASRSGSRSGSDADDGGSVSGQRGPSREVSSFRVRISSESSGMGTLSEEHDEDQPDEPDGPDGPDQPGRTLAPAKPESRDLIDLA
jgi:hypothetical protein